MKQIAGAVKDAIGRLVPMAYRGVDAETSHLPFDVVASRGPMRVLYFAPRGEVRHATPIVFSYSLINRFYILDFMPGRSLLEYLTESGHPCYVIDWGVPGIAEVNKTWADYAITYVDLAMRTACEREGTDRAHLYGYCMGGTMALAYAALRPARIKAVVAMAVPVDFHDEGLFSTWTRPANFNPDAIVDAFGNVPTWLMEGGSRLLMPLTNATKWRDLWENRERDGFAEIWRRMEAWSSDNVPFPGELYRQYIKDCYQTNNFRAGRMFIGGERVDLSRIDAPTLAVIALRDHIVPPPSARALLDVIGSEDTAVMEFATGHIGLSASSKGRSVFWPAISGWLVDHD